MCGNIFLDDEASYCRRCGNNAPADGSRDEPSPIVGEGQAQEARLQALAEGSTTQVTKTDSSPRPASLTPGGPPRGSVRPKPLNPDHERILEEEKNKSALSDEQIEEIFLEHSMD